MNQQEYNDCMKINGKYFDIHPHDIKQTKQDRLKQCISFLNDDQIDINEVGDDYHMVVKKSLFDCLFEEFNRICEHELELYESYAEDRRYDESYETIDDPHADAMADLPF